MLNHNIKARKDLHERAEIWEGKATNTAFNCLLSAFLQMSPVVIPSRGIKLVAVPLADSDSTFQVSIKQGRTQLRSWSLSCKKSQAFNIDLALSIYKDGASFVQRKRAFGKVACRAIPLHPMLLGLAVTLQCLESYEKLFRNEWAN